MKLKTKKEYVGLMPPLSTEEYTTLYTSIRKKGLYLPIIVNPKGIILDGHHRFEICKKLGINPKVEVKEFDGLILEKKFIIESNLQRRQLTPFQRIESAKLLIEIERELAEQREKAGKKITLSPNGTRVKGKTTELVAPKIGVSERTLERGLFVAKKADERTKERLRKGKMRIATAYKQIKEREMKKRMKTPPLPKNKYRTVVIDPPWKNGKILREVRPNQVEFDYPTMSLEEIKKFPIPDLFNLDGCHVYLWTTHKHLPDAFEVFKAWGIKYQCVLTWIKNVGFTPFSWMYSTELVLFGRVGNLDLLRKGLRLDFYGKVREHSRKPDQFYDLVKLVSPRPRIDVFSREKREGFDQYGTEIKKFTRI